MEKEVEGKRKIDEILERLGIDLKVLEEEQIKLRKGLQLKDTFDKESINVVAGCDNAYFDNKIISAIVVVDENFEILEEKFAVGKAGFPYVPGFLAYRELPIMLECYKKIENVPDLFIIDGNGILHPREFGLASHFGLSVNKPTIGVAKSLTLGEIKGEDIYVDKKILGKCVMTKEGSKPIYVSQGNMISLKTAVDTVKKYIKQPHKLPEPLFLAHHFADKIREELGRKSES